MPSPLIGDAFVLFGDDLGLMDGPERAPGSSPAWQL